MSAISATASHLPTGKASMCPTRWRARRSRSRRSPAIIPTAGACSRSNAQARNGSRRSARISASAAAARSSTGRPSAIAPGSATSWSRRWRRPASNARSARWSTPMALGRRRITLHARMGTHDVLKVGFAAASSHDIIPVDRCPILDPGLRWRARCGLGARRAADLDRQAARHPDHRDRQRPRRRRARLRAAADGHDRDAVARRRTAPPGAADAPWRTGADAHAAGRSRSAPRRSPCRRARSCRRPSPAKRRWRRWSRIIASAPNISPTCSAGSDRSRCGLRRRSRVAAFDSDAGAVAALQKAATSTPGLKPVKAEARDLFRRPLMPQELRDYDAVVFDPPRQGAQAQVDAACGQQDPDRSWRCPATSRPSRATRES